VDLREFGAVRGAFEGTDIIRTAVQFAGAASLTDPRMDFEVNGLGTFSVLETARQNDSAVRTRFTERT